MRCQNLIEDQSAAAWYQQSILSLPNKILYTVKECQGDTEYHLIR